MAAVTGSLHNISARPTGSLPLGEEEGFPSGIQKLLEDIFKNYGAACGASVIAGIASNKISKIGSVRQKELAAEVQSAIETDPVAFLKACTAIVRATDERRKQLKAAAKENAKAVQIFLGGSKTPEVTLKELKEAIKERPEKTSQTKNVANEGVKTAEPAAEATNSLLYHLFDLWALHWNKLPEDVNRRFLRAVPLEKSHSFLSKIIKGKDLSEGSAWRSLAESYIARTTTLAKKKFAVKYAPNLEKTDLEDCERLFVGLKQLSFSDVEEGEKYAQTAAYLENLQIEGKRGTPFHNLMRHLFNKLLAYFYRLVIVQERKDIDVSIFFRDIVCKHPRLAISALQKKPLLYLQFMELMKLYGYIGLHTILETYDRLAETINTTQFDKDDQDLFNFFVITLEQLFNTPKFLDEKKEDLGKLFDRLFRISNRTKIDNSLLVQTAEVFLIWCYPYRGKLDDSTRKKIENWKRFLGSWPLADAFNKNINADREKKMLLAVCDRLDSWENPFFIPPVLSMIKDAQKREENFQNGLLMQLYLKCIQRAERLSSIPQSPNLYLEIFKQFEDQLFHTKKTQFFGKLVTCLINSCLNSCNWGHVFELLQAFEKNGRISSKSCFEAATEAFLRIKLEKCPIIPKWVDLLEKYKAAREAEEFAATEMKKKTKPKKSHQNHTRKGRKK